MNEEIKRQSEEIIDNLWILIDEKLKQAYLQGAKDMAKAVELEEVESLDDSDPSKWGDAYTSRNIAGTALYNSVIRKINTKAQQFIDSLEKESSHS